MRTRQFLFETTADGSPTLRIGAEGDAPSESMHSLRGAFSETAYVYGSAMRLMLDQAWEPRVLSVGLGLGYVEILFAAMATADGRGHAFSGESFESEPELRRWFANWLGSSAQDEPSETPDAPEGFAEAYDGVLARSSAWAGAELAGAKRALHDAVSGKRWRLRAALGPATDFARPFSCICFDAFSSKTTPDLWTEEFLDDFLRKAAAPACVLSTYACTGRLKRSLKRAGFELEIREGFASKRDSVFAVRRLAVER